MSVFKPIAEDVCPPFHCECGWSEMCVFENKEGCKKCDQYEKCYRL